MDDSIAPTSRGPFIYVAYKGAGCFRVGYHCGTVASLMLRTVLCPRGSIIDVPFVRKSIFGPEIKKSLRKDLRMHRVSSVHNRLTDWYSIELDVLVKYIEREINTLSDLYHSRNLQRARQREKHSMRLRTRQQRSVPRQLFH